MGSETKFRSVRHGDFDWLAVEYGADRKIALLHPMARLGHCAARRGERCVTK